MKLKIFEFHSATSCHCLEGADVGVDGNKQDAAVAAGCVKKNKIKRTLKEALVHPNILGSSPKFPWTRRECCCPSIFVQDLRVWSHFRPSQLSFPLYSKMKIIVWNIFRKQQKTVSIERPFDYCRNLNINPFGCFHVLPLLDQIWMF